jgi:hypothetical protein
MANMGYCNFENTYADLRLCRDDMDRNDLSDREAKYRQLLLELCADIVRDFGETR